MCNMRERIQLALEEYGPLNKAVEASRAETGGRIIVVSRYLHGDNAVAHLAFWSHDDNGRLIIGENWNVAVPFPVAVYPDGHVERVQEIFPTTLEAARDWLGY